MSTGTPSAARGDIGVWACDALQAAVLSGSGSPAKEAFDALDGVPLEEMRRVAGYLAAVAAQAMSARQRRRPADFVDRLRMELTWSES
jgi:hypothetical protein